jgi:MATE family, multidrug efflux pump
MTIDAPTDAVPPRAPAASPITSLLTAPILPTLLRLAIPNMIAMVGSTLVAIAETSYIGRLGTVPLAAIALVFPFAMLMQMMSAGAMGGGVSSAISRALGAGNRKRAATLALHAAIIGLCGGLFFTVTMLVFGRNFVTLLGGRGDALEEACNYSQVLFSGAIAIWLVNTLASVIRGTGDMRLPSMTLIAASLVQIVVGGTLGLGLFGLPQFGMRGVASGQLIAFTLAAIFFLWYLLSGRSRLPLNFRAFHFEGSMFRDILKVGAIACLAPLQTVLTILVFTKILASFGTEMLAGYGIGSRLEFLLTPITFAFGIASVPMVGMAIGAGQLKRARHIAWTAAAAAGLTVGLIGAIVALDPALWVSLFARDVGVAAAAHSYFRLAGPAFVFFGVGASLYFSSQGAARVGGPVLASTARLLIVAVGGVSLTVAQAPAWTLFALVGCSMAVFGLSTAASVALARWGK